MVIQIRVDIVVDRVVILEVRRNRVEVVGFARRRGERGSGDFGTRFVGRRLDRLLDNRSLMRYAFLLLLSPLYVPLISNWVPKVAVLEVVSWCVILVTAWSGCDYAAVTLRQAGKTS